MLYICFLGFSYRYAGPGSQRVTKQFDMGTTTYNWLMYLKSTHRLVVSSIDGRGSKSAGEKFKREIYKRLGTVEVEDQISGAE